MMNGVSPHSQGDKTKQNGFGSAAIEIEYINAGEEDQMEIYGYEWSALYSTLTWLCMLLTIGWLRLIFHWYPEYMLYTTHKRCPLYRADKVLVVECYQGKYKSYFVKQVKKLSAQNVNLESPEDLMAGMNEETVKHLKSSTRDKLRVYLNNGKRKDVEELRVVWVKKLCYVWDEEHHTFHKLVGLDRGVTAKELHQFTGYDVKQQFLRRIVYGYNEIVVPVQTISTLLFLEIINPFYIFQMFTLAVWLAENYYYYTVAIIIMSVFGVSSSIIQTRRNQKNLHDTVTSTDVVTVWRGGDDYEEIPSSHLVPGDVIVIPVHGCDMHCDAVLLNGNCIVNESMLTGESVPVTKTPLPRLTSVYYNAKEDVTHTLFCGTKVIQTRYYNNERVRAVVLRTGYLTAKGNLVRSILYPPPADFKFDQDSYKFIGVLAIIAAIGLIYTIVTKSSRGITPGDIAIKALDIITIVIPPALPAAMTVGKLYAQHRLKARNIYCINSRVINVSGSLDCVCFDKTGTLTEDGLDMWGVVPVEGRRFGLHLKDIKLLSRGPMLYGMVSCHSITIINGSLSGDPLDVKMFESTGWLIEEPDIADNSKYDLLVPTVVRPPTGDVVKDPSNPDIQIPFEIGLLHQFQFSSTLQRMSVVTRTLGSKQFVVYCKGSPEMIVSLSKPETVPLDLMAALQEYTEQGYRVIALATRFLSEQSFLKVQRMTREDAEKDLDFLGLIILENRLKPQTTGTIRDLRGANVKIVMITGDNIQTAVSVAKECGIIEAGETVIDVTVAARTETSPAAIYYTSAAISTSQAMKTGRSNGALRLGNGDVEEGRAMLPSYKFAVAGSSWQLLREHFPEFVPRIASRGAVFARMSSDQKQQLVQELKELDYYVAMCGDGANDCGALKAAHAGISLSEAESSVASPFTSREANISCVPQVIRQGRAALSTSFGVFKFMIAYSLTEFLSAIILYNIDSNLTDLQFLFIDICLIVNFAFFFGKTEAYAGPLVKQPPMTSLLSVAPMLSLILQMAVIIAIQVISYYGIQRFSWFTPFQFTPTSGYTCLENYAVFTVSMFQYIALAIVFSQGKPYRKPIYTNKTLLTSLILMTLICTYITVYPADWLIKLLQLTIPPGYAFKVVVLCLAAINLVIAIFMESFVVEFQYMKKIKPYVEWSKRKFEKVEDELIGDESWPPISKRLPISHTTSTPEVDGFSDINLDVMKDPVTQGVKPNPEDMTTNF